MNCVMSFRVCNMIAIDFFGEKNNVINGNRIAAESIGPVPQRWN